MISNSETYAEAVLRLYVQLPDTSGRVRPADRRLALQLHTRQIPLPTVESALLLASARRCCRPSHRPPLPQIRALAYFLPAIDEVLQQPLPANYIDYLRAKLFRSRSR